MARSYLTYIFACYDRGSCMQVGRARACGRRRHDRSAAALATALPRRAATSTTACAAPRTAA